MDNNNDAARVLLRRFVEVFDNVNEDAFDTAIADHPQQYGEVRARSLQHEPVPPIVEGEQFSYRNQVRLAGLHNQQRRGICYNPSHATCIVARYPRHNPDHSNQQNGNLIVGGEGGFIREANRQNLRVMDDQQLTIGEHARVVSFWRELHRIVEDDQLWLYQMHLHYRYQKPQQIDAEEHGQHHCCYP
ncbi:unnamed protein product [Trifolium pratense]|uniref:Uncharacterized protein n=1 Tax=Trifolium pratense TaxID=57577 RepID=A0ACB0KW70_TRIPR|nr:unnamed protein product [Trifolium pratense]